MSHLSKARFILICALSYCCMGQAGCQTTSSQDITYIRSDIVRIKRDMEDLKKQSGSPTGGGGYADVVRNQAVQGETLLELQEGQQRTESRIEEVRYELSALKQEITNLKLNLISQMEAMRATGAAKPVPRQPEPIAAPPTAQTSSWQPSLTPAPSSPQEPTRPKEPTPPTPPTPPVAAAASDSAPTVAPSRPEEPINYTKLYDTAYEDYVRKNYALARGGFEEYLRLYGETDLADNAQYWVGECFYAEGKYEEAADAFQTVITRYPTGNKVPRAMLKAGFALLQLGRTDQAKAMFQQVIDAYPLSSEADQAKDKLKKLQ